VSANRTGSETTLPTTDTTETTDGRTQENPMARADRRATQEKTQTRCTTCTGTLFVKLTRETGAVRRQSYCPECAAARDVTSAAGRRALFVQAAARELLGAA
jgi:hypothetical protein